MTIYFVLAVLVGVIVGILIAHTRKKREALQNKQDVHEACCTISPSEYTLDKELLNLDIDKAAAPKPALTKTYKRKPPDKDYMRFMRCSCRK